MPLIICRYDKNPFLRERGGYVDMDWIPCKEGQMPEDSGYINKEIINCLVTTDKGIVTKVQRIRYTDYNGQKEDKWYWGRIRGEMRAWMPQPKPYKE